MSVAVTGDVLLGDVALVLHLDVERQVGRGRDVGGACPW